MIRKKWMILLISLLMISSLSAVSRKFKIQEVSYLIKGNVRESSLNSLLDWDSHNIFNNKQELDQYLISQRQILVNKKIFKSVFLDFEILENNRNYDSIKILVYLEEAWNIYPVPIYTYDSNLGMVTGLKLNYYNFAGTITDLTVSGYYSPFKSEVSTTLEGVRIGSFDLDIGISQLWETVKAVDEQGEINLEYSYTKSLFDTSIKFHILKNLDYIITPKIYYPFQYVFSTNETGQDEDLFIETGLIPAFSHSILYDHVNWVGNLRQGFNINIENGINYQPSNNDYIIWNDAIITTFLYTPVLNYSSRVSGFYYFRGYRENSGDRLRGILDYKLTGTKGFFWNQNFVIPVVKIPSIMDIHISPFLDMGYLGDENSIFLRDDLLYTAGVSLTLFPQPLPNIQINMDYGINLDDTSETEVLISSVLYF